MASFGDFMRGVSTVLPEVPKPLRKPSLTIRFLWTAVALVLYLTMAQIPLYGVQTGAQDQMSFMRVIFASAQGTLMELGIGPIVTAGLILQLLKGSEIIKVDFKKPEDRALFTAATKFMTLIVTLVEASAFILGGAYNAQPGVLPPFNMILIILLQLFFAGIAVMLLDELVQKGWGIGSGVSLFILAGVAQTVVWSIFSPIPTGEGPLGVIPFIITSIASGSYSEILFRSQGLPSLFTLLLTILSILTIIYFEGMRIEIPITSSRYRGFSGVYPIKLLYVSNIPIILTSALIANLTFFAQLLWSRFNPTNSNVFLNLFVTFDPADLTQGPNGGLVHYMTAPRSLELAMGEPLRALSYVAITVLFSIMFARIWIEIAGLSSRAVAKSLVDAKVQVPGFRRASTPVESILSRYIPIVTIIGAVFIGLLASLSDILGTIGTGTGLLLSVDIILQYYQMLMREQLETMMPRLAGALGAE